MSDLEQFYVHASKCAKTIQEAFTKIPKHAQTVSRARRHLARAQTAFGEPEVSHERRVRLCREAASALEQAIVNFETNASVVEIASGIRKAHRRLRSVQLANL